MINSLLTQIENSEIVLPAIQRDFVWNENRITMMFDSIMRGYPLGIALLWETYLDIKYREFNDCLLYTSPSPRDRTRSRMPSSA